MAPKPAYLWLCFFLPVALAACSPKIAISPTADQKAIATGVAATLNAASTATQRAILTSQPAASFTPTSQPTLADTALPEATPTLAATPTTQAPAPAEMVAYTKYSDVYVWTPKNGPTRLTDMHDVVSVRLSPDGALIAFKRQDEADITLQELWAVNTSGIPNPVQLVSADELAALVPPDAGSSILGYGVYTFSWRPGTHQLAYNTVILHEGVGLGLNHDLRLVDVDTMLKTTLFSTGQGGLFYYSPDGQQIALSNPESIGLVNADGSNLRRDLLTFPGVITYSEYEYHPHPRWGEDSVSLGVAIPPHDPLNDPTPLTGLWNIPADGSPAVLLGKVPAIPFAWPDNAFSPDLNLVAYSSQAAGSDPNQRDLHVSNPDGSGNRIYASGEALEFTSWSPDSQHFIYAIQGGAKEGVYIGGINASPRLLFDKSNSVRDVKWVDGTRFVCLISINDQSELLLSNVNGEYLGVMDTIPDTSPDFDTLP